MKTEKNIGIAFFLNLFFSIFELFGGIFTGSAAIISDAVHDFGDAMSIGVSFFLERRSKKAPDQRHTYGYGRYRVIGGLITTLVLLLGSVLAVVHGVSRLLHPAQIHYNGMILFAVVGVGVNLAAALVTRGKDSVNQRAVNLHMLEDVLGWIVVLLGAIVMRFTQLWWLDPVLSILVAGYIFYHGVGNLVQILGLLLERVPEGMTAREAEAALLQAEGVESVHHIHLWLADDRGVCLTAHIVTASQPAAVKAAARKKLEKLGIRHAVLELETPEEICPDPSCTLHTLEDPEGGHHHHHHHHHGHSHHGHDHHKHDPHPAHSDHEHHEYHEPNHSHDHDRSSHS